MANNSIQAGPETQTVGFTSESLLKHWQGHRSLTRRVIEAFPEKELFTFSIGGMRPFSMLAMEMIDMGGPGVVGMATNEWKKLEELDHFTKKGIPTTKKELLEKWDEITSTIEACWPKISTERMQEITIAFGLYENPVYQILFYFIDNEIHHRGQGYVYLRALGIEPPPFWDRP